MVIWRAMRRQLPHGPVIFAASAGVTLCHFPYLTEKIEEK
tara:strand:- start:2924 stop:3043 length:120 start_codon:yes stop_codon:yes gene_type:complete